MAEVLDREEIRAWPSAASEAERQAGELSEEYIVEQIEACKTEADDATREERQVMRDLV